MVDLSKVESGIKKTGFALEYLISEKFRNHGWSIISNKYYVDDVAGSIREIDLIAYKVGLVEKTRIYTAIIVSCKKSEQNAWALIAKDVNKTDPNKDWYPLHNWTNDPILRFWLERKPWQKEYIDQGRSKKFFDKLFEPRFDIFAFQEMHKANGTPQNDKNIFNAVTSLMKAQAYEMSIREKRPKPVSSKEGRLYSFTLFSVVDSDLLRLRPTSQPGGTVRFKCEEITEEKFIGSYIINNEQVTARVNFVRADDIEEHILALNNLHIFNLSFWESKLGEYYDAPFESKAATDVFIDVFRDRVFSRLRWKLNELSIELERDDINLWAHEDAEYVEIGLPVDQKIVDLLNQDEQLSKVMGKAIKDVYRYEGDLGFGAEYDIPF